MKALGRFLHANNGFDSLNDYCLFFLSKHAPKGLLILLHSSRDEDNSPCFKKIFFECTFYYPVGFPKPSLPGRDFLWSHVCLWYVHYGHDNSHYINKPWRVWFLTWSCILFLFLCVGSSAPVFELTLGSEDVWGMIRIFKKQWVNGSHN